MTPLQPCGTYAAAFRHKKAGEPLCDPCAEARRAYWRETKRLKRRTPRRPVRFVDELAVRHAVAGYRMRLTRDERRAAVAALTDMGWAASRIATQLQVTDRTVVRLRAAARLVATESAVHRDAESCCPVLWETENTPKPQQGQAIRRSQPSSEVA